MIVLDLICATGHHFEGWFASLEVFDDQALKRLVNCPHCGSASVQRLPSTPYVVKGTAPVAAKDPAEADMARFIKQLRAMASMSEDVGDQFPEEARRIHYQEVPERQIRGQASIDEARDLLDEGILVLPVPPKKDIH